MMREENLAYLMSIYDVGLQHFSLFYTFKICKKILVMIQCFVFRFRGVHGHFHGSLPWWKIEDFVISESAKLVGKAIFF